MSPLEYQMKNQMDPRLPGLISNSVKRGYALFDELTTREQILKLFQAKNAYGMLRHVYVDIAFQSEAERSGLPLTFEQHQVSKNGYTYPVIYDGHSAFTLHKTRSKKSLPKSAWNRNSRSFLNREIDLFNPAGDETQELAEMPYIMVTYGGPNYKLRYVNLSLPNVGVTAWLDQCDITDAVSVTSTPSRDEKRKLNLAFNDRVQQLLEREKTNDGGQV
ncbi:hypothetical protein [Lacticaseibacillus sp. GG6-2]